MGFGNASMFLSDNNSSDFFLEDNITSLGEAGRSFSRQKSPTEVRMDALTMGLLRYVLPVIIAVGTFGNFLCVIVIVRKRMLGKSVYLYLLLLACADSAVLYLSALKTWVRVVFGVEFLHASDAACKTLMFLFVMSLHMSAWLIVFMTSDRFVAVWFPLKAAIFCTTRRAAIVSVICFAILVIYNAQLFWTFHLQTFQTSRGEKKVCGPYSTDFFHNYTYNYLKLATYSFIPFLIVIVFNMGIVIKLNRETPITRNSITVKSENGVTFRSITHTRNRLETETQRRITYMLLSVSISWLVLTLPFTLFSALPGSWLVHPQYGRSPGTLAKVVCFLLMYANHSINFFLYCLTGKKFRREVADVLCLVPVRKRVVSRKRSPTLTTTRMRTGETSGQSSREDLYAYRLQEAS